MATDFSSPAPAASLRASSSSFSRVSWAVGIVRCGDVAQQTSVTVVLEHGFRRLPESPAVARDRRWTFLVLRRLRPSLK